MKNMIKDDFGYISGRGLSKYWGVSKQQLHDGGQDPWVVKFADPYIEVGKTNRYRLFTAKDFNLSELDAAKIGAFFHANPMPFCNYPPRVHFRSANDKFDIIVDTRSKIIYKASALDIPKVPVELSAKQELLKQQQERFDAIIAEAAGIANPEEVLEASEEQSEYDKGFAAGYALREIIERRLGSKSLKTILKTVEERLKGKNRV